MNGQKCWWCFERIRCYFIVFFLTPTFFAFEMLIVRPKYVESYAIGNTEQAVYILFACFLFINVTGNMFISILTNTSMKGFKGYGSSYCEICDTKRPEGSWHCYKCNACIVARDHHCTFLARCIGLYNQRYYVLYLGYVSLSMLYSSYFNFWYIYSMYEDNEMFLATLEFLTTNGCLLRTMPYNYRDLLLLFLYMNFGLFVWMGILFTLHFNNVLKGTSARASRSRNGRNSTCSEDWKTNIIKVFGEKWYWAMLWPFAESPLPLNVKNN